MADPIVSLFAPAASAAFGTQVAGVLGLMLSALEEREFEGGEHKMRPLVSVRGHSTYVVHSLHGDERGSANDRLCRLLFLVATLKDAGAARVSVCVPYLAYARKDRRTKAHDPVTTRYVAQLFEAVGTDRIVALDVHNPASYENAFRCEAVHVTAADLLMQNVAADSSLDYVVASPDIGGIKRARHFRELLEGRLGHGVGSAFMEKKRSDGLVTGETFVGEVANRCVIIVDDLISSGETVSRAVRACRRAGAARIEVAATHATFASEAHALFEADGPDVVVVTDSVALPSSFTRYLQGRLRVIEVAPRIAEAIRRLEHGGSVSELGGA
jgi:ribose-phosphate pyrophosphokinase